MSSEYLFFKARRGAELHMAAISNGLNDRVLFEVQMWIRGFLKREITFNDFSVILSVVKAIIATERPEVQFLEAFEEIFERFEGQPLTDPRERRTWCCHTYKAREMDVREIYVPWGMCPSQVEVFRIYRAIDFARQNLRATAKSNEVEFLTLSASSYAGKLDDVPDFGDLVLRGKKMGEYVAFNNHGERDVVIVHHEDMMTIYDNLTTLCLDQDGSLRNRRHGDTSDRLFSVDLNVTDIGKSRLYRDVGTLIQDIVMQGAIDRVRCKRGGPHSVKLTSEYFNYDISILPGDRCYDLALSTNMSLNGRSNRSESRFLSSVDDGDLLSIGFALMDRVRESRESVKFFHRCARAITIVRDLQLGDLRSAFDLKRAKVYASYKEQPGRHTGRKCTVPGRNSLTQEFLSGILSSPRH